MNPVALRIAGNVVALAGAVLIVFGQGELAWLRYVGIFIACLGFAAIVGSMFIRRKPGTDDGES